MNIYDLMYFLTILMAVVCMIASFRVSSVFKKYDRVRSMTGMTGAQAAIEILRRNGITDVSVMPTNGRLTDNYDPVNRVVHLSESSYGSASVAAVGVAAHECGHVLQHQQSYLPLKLRSAVFPVANIGSRAGVPLAILGIFLGFGPLVDIGICVFSVAVLFHLITLPVEFDASRRALAMVQDYGFLSEEETAMSKKVLTAAAMTYVASAATSVLQLLRLMALRGRRD
jgi:Zn-dependent membrane protease YugP